MDQVTGDGPSHLVLHHPPHQQQQALQAQQVLMASEINQESFREYARFRQSILTSTHPHHRLSGSPDDASLNEEHRRKKNNEVIIQKKNNYKIAIIIVRHLTLFENYSKCRI